METKTDTKKSDQRSFLAYGHMMAYDVAEGKWVLFGGLSTQPGNAILSDTWVWDGTNWTQKKPSNSPALRFEHSMVYDTVMHKCPCSEESFGR